MIIDRDKGKEGTLMNTFEHVQAKEVDAIFNRIDKQWMLISATDGERTNTMTASWGAMGILWHKPVAICFIRPQRYTYSITEKSDHLSLAFLGEEYRDALVFCGRNSGRDGDKFEQCGLTCAYTEGGVPYPQEAQMVMICRKLYADDMKKSAFVDTDMFKHYPIDDFHRVYICEIEDVLVKK